MSYKHEEEYKLALEEMKQDPGCTYKYLAAKYHFDYRCFKTYLKRQGIVKERSYLSKNKYDDYQRGIELYKQGYSCLFASKEINVSNNSLMHYMKEHCPEIK